MKIQLYGSYLDNKTDFKLEDMTDEEFYQFLKYHPDPELLGNVLYDKLKSGVKKIKEKIKKAFDKAKQRSESIPALTKLTQPIEVKTTNIPAPVPTVPELKFFLDQLKMKTPARSAAPQLAPIITKPAEMRAPSIVKPDSSVVKTDNGTIYEPVLDQVEPEKNKIPGWVWIGLATIPFII